MAASELAAPCHETQTHEPGESCHKFVNLTDPNQAKQILRAIGLNVLQEVKDLPKTATPDWLETLEKADEGK